MGSQGCHEARGLRGWASSCSSCVGANMAVIAIVAVVVVVEVHCCIARSNSYSASCTTREGA